MGVKGRGGALRQSQLEGSEEKMEGALLVVAEVKPPAEGSASFWVKGEKRFVGNSSGPRGSASALRNYFQRSASAFAGHYRRSASAVPT